MTPDAANLLAEIRRAGGDVTLVGCDKLKLVAPTALVPELAEKVRAAKAMLLVVLADTGRTGREAARPLCNGATAQAQQSAAAPASGRTIPTPAADWRARHREALAYWGTFHPADEAAQLAWGELQIRWHRLHGERSPKWQCSGCGEPIGGLAALTLADGGRVHFDKLNCLLRFGRRWRHEATARLSALGLDRPAGFDREQREAD